MRAFDIAVPSLQNLGYRITRMDRRSRTIEAEMIPQSSQQPVTSLNINIEMEDTTSIVRLEVRGGEDSLNSATLCRFYDEFERSVKGSLTSPKSKSGPTVESSQKPTAKSLPPSVPVPPAQTPPASMSPKATHVVWSNVNLRGGPGMKYPIVGTAKRGTPLTILDGANGWLYVRLEDGKEVWVAKSATEEALKAPPPRSSTPASQKASSSIPSSPM